MRHLVSAMLVVVAIIHLVPLSGLLGTERLAVLYGIQIEEPNLAILMRHRAVLFGLLGVFLLYAAFR
ncbi:MAG: phosphopantetheine adenylyltransferase, partial [Burkholderiales bacterium]